jgi:hypothetical protein
LGAIQLANFTIAPMFVRRMINGVAHAVLGAPALRQTPFIT